MGLTAENLAERYGISREAQDRFALESQGKAAAAIQSGRFTHEIAPHEVKKRKETIAFDTDEQPRETSLEKLAKLNPVFKEGGTVTAGSAHHRSSFNRVQPDIMGIGPVPATRLALKRAGLRLADIDLIELNEAFAAQALVVV